MKKIDVLIVGAGIAGLGCARTLFENGEYFHILTEDIGGRILMSKDGQVPYGAYFIGVDYHHVSPYFKKARRIHLFKTEFHKGKKFYFLSILWRYPWQLLKFWFLLKKFRTHYSLFKKRCEHMSQHEAFLADPYLNDLYHQRADAWVKKYSMHDFVDAIVAEGIYGILFLHPHELYAFEFLRWAQYLFVPTYELEFLEHTAISGFRDRIIFDSVTSVEKQQDGYVVHTKNGKRYQCCVLVLATPIHITQRLLHLPSIKESVSAYMFHIDGKIRKQWTRAELHVFHSHSNIFDIAYQADGTYLFYCRQPNPNFDDYFITYSIIAKKHWNPAFHLNGDELLDTEQGENLYVIGDHNVCGMEDSYITGMYAAKKIVAS